VKYVAAQNRRKSPDSRARSDNRDNHGVCLTRLLQSRKIRNKGAASAPRFVTGMTRS
jgi:hypothetical protein